MTIEYKDSKRIVALSTDEAPTPDLTYDDFPTSYSGWTKSSNDATKLAFSSNRVNFSIGETYVDARAYGYDIGFDLDGDYCIDFDFTMTNAPFTSSGQAVAFTFGISTTTADVGGEDPTMNSEQTKIAGYPSGSHVYIYARTKSSAGTNAAGNDTNTAFPNNSSATQLRYGRLSRSGTTFRVQFFSDSTRETEVANYSVTTTAQTVRYLYLKSYSQNSGQAWAGYLDNIKIYKDQSSPTPVKPTNVQDNSILVEKDTSRRYWASNKDTIEDDYSSASGWTSSGAGNISITGGQVSASSLGNNDGEDRIYRTVSGVDSTDVTVQFEVTFSAWTSGSWYEGVAQLQSCTQDAVLYSGTQADCDVAGVHLIKNHSNSNFFGIVSKDGTNSAVFTNGTVGISQGTKYYLTFEKSGNDMTLTVRTGSHSGSTHDTITKTQTGITGLNTLVHGTLTGFAGGTGYTTSYTIDNLVVSPVSYATWTPAPKTPAEIGDLKVHYDATVGVTASSNSVSAWADQSGNGKTLSSVSNPTRVEAGQNGKDYIDFNSSKSMRASGLSEDVPRPFTMVAVINPRNTSDQSIIRWGQSPYLALYQYPVNTYYISGGSDVGLSDSTLDGSWNAFFMDFKSDADGGTLQINLDTANAVSGDLGDNGTSGSGSNSQPSTLHVGVNGTNNNWYANCRYAEIIMFDKVLTAYEKEQLYGHLKTKWGLP